MAAIKLIISQKGREGASEEVAGWSAKNVSFVVVVVGAAVAVSPESSNWSGNQPLYDEAWKGGAVSIFGDWLCGILDVVFNSQTCFLTNLSDSNRFPEHDNSVDHPRGQTAKSVVASLNSWKPHDANCGLFFKCSFSRRQHVPHACYEVS